jgi:hypothetical protein
VNQDNFIIENPPDGTVQAQYRQFIWVEKLDEIKNTTKIFFSPKAIEEVVSVINNEKLHESIFNKKLTLK